MYHIPPEKATGYFEGKSDAKSDIKVTFVYVAFVVRFALDPNAMRLESQELSAYAPKRAAPNSPLEITFEELIPLPSRGGVVSFAER